MALLTAMSNSFGARWFDEKWQPQFDSPEWKKTLSTYVDLMKAAGPPGASSNGSMKISRCSTPAVRDVDRRHGGGVLRDQPQGLPGRGPGRLCTCPECRAWQERQLAVGPGISRFLRVRRRLLLRKNSSHGRPARTTPQLVAKKEGWANVPPGTRTSLYQNPEYLKVAPFAKLTLASIDAADPNKPTVQPVSLRRGAIRGYSGIPGHRHERRPVNSRRRCLAPRPSMRRSPQRNHPPNAK